MTSVRIGWYHIANMSELTSNSLLERSLALTVQELEELLVERAKIEDEFRARIEPLDRRISTLDAAARHQRRALEALDTEAMPAPQKMSNRQPLYAAVGAKLTDVLESILTEAGRPMHYRVLAEEAIRLGVAITAKDPGAFVINYLRREPDRFCRTETAGEYGLLSWGLPGSRRMGESRPAAKSTKARPKRKARATKGRAR